MRTLRNVFRKRFRAFLTIFGITIGIFALVVMGSMAEKITLLVDGGTQWISDKVTVSSGDLMSLSSSPIPLDKMDQIRAVDGVAEVSAGVTMTLNEEPATSLSMPDMMAGTDLRGRDLESYKVHLSAGRSLQPDDDHKAVVGADLVDRLNAQVGSIINIRGQDFEVVGTIEKTLASPDTTVTIPLKNAQQLFYDSQPEVVKASITPDQVVTDFTVYPQPGQDPDELAQRIQQQVPNVRTMGPAVFQEKVTNNTRIFTSIIFGVALISLLVGALSVINTMTMAVSERTREIGIRKSLGASDGRIIRQFLAEAAVIGLIGGLAGLALGWAFTIFANSVGAASGNAVFLLTPRLAGGSVAFAVVLGVVSGMYPSWRAARMNPVAALRYE